MGYLALYAYELACTAIPAFIVYLALIRLARNRSDADGPPAVFAAIFAVYLFALLHFTGAGTLHDAMRFGFDPNPHQMSLIPFAGFAEDVDGHLLNVLLFVPLGLLVPTLSGRNLGTLPAVTTAIVASLAIEFSQLLNSRITDIDDLLMNVAGTLVGYCVFGLIERKRKNHNEKTPGMILAVLMLITAFLGRFLLYNEMGLAKILFGF